MRQRVRSRPGSWLAAAILLALGQLSCGTMFDVGLELKFGEGGSGTERGSSAPLPLGSWTRDNLNCSAGLCERWYEIEIDEPGMLRVDVYAPVGPGLPDCELRLEDDDGNLLEARTGRVQTQRRLRYESEDGGTYLLRVAAKSPEDELFDFEVVAEVREPGPRKPAVVSRPKPEPRPSPRPDIPLAKMPQKDDGEPEESTDVDVEPIPEPTPVGPVVGPAEPPPPEPEWVVAEVLDVEEEDGRPTAVMLEAGLPDGVATGMRGELFEGDQVIGTIAVLDVYPTGCRARIVGELVAPVSFDTLSRIEIPAPRPTSGN